MPESHALAQNETFETVETPDLSYPWPYLIGDIHGCLTEYLELEARIQQHARQQGATPLIVSVGDLVDRGPDSAGVVAHFYQGEQQGSHHAIIGNHELMMLQVIHHLAPWNFTQPGCAWPERHWTLEQMFELREGMARYLSWEDYAVTMKALWVGQGGYQTLRSYGMDPETPATWSFDAEILRYLLDLPFYWQNEQVVVTHALAQPDDLSLIRHSSENAYSGDEEAMDNLRKAAHSLLWNRALPTTRPDPSRQHVSGHTPLPRVRRWKLMQCVQIDTGCVYGRRLSAYCLPTNQSLSVPAKKNYLAGG